MIKRSQLAVIFAITTMSSLAVAQPNVDCLKTETQAECHARLQCHADEDVDQCQKRLRASGQTNNNRNDQRDDRGDRRDDRRNDRGDRRDDRGDRRDDRRDRRDDNRRSRRRSRDRGSRSSGFEANKTFGLGLELGEPSGLNGKYFLSDSRALDFGVGYIYSSYYFGDGFHLYGDHLWHPTSLASSPALELPFYIGVGLRYWSFDYCERVGNVDVCDSGSAIGVRIPIGLSIDFNNTPVDIFFQLVPVIDFTFGDYYDRFDDRNHFGIDGSIGIRFWFK